MKRCFFIGHRDAPEKLLKQLTEIVEMLYKEHEVREFVAGHYGRFDRCSANAVKVVKHNHADISLVMLLPYHPAQRAFDLPEGFDGSFYPFETERIPGKAAIVKANRYMIDHSDFVVAYAKYVGSNAMKYLDYAQRRQEQGGLRVINLAQDTLEPWMT